MKQAQPATPASGLDMAFRTCIFSVKAVSKGMKKDVIIIIACADPIVTFSMGRICERRLSCLSSVGIRALTS